MRFYELVFIARQDLTPAQVEGLARQYTNVIKEHGGDVTKTEFCGLRTLAYQIKKNSKGHYVLLNVSADNKGLNEVERQIRLNEDILRHLTVRVEELSNQPSPLMQNRTFRDGRDDDFDADEF